MPSPNDNPGAPGQLDDGSFDLSDCGPEDEAFLAEVEAAAREEAKAKAGDHAPDAPDDPSDPGDPIGTIDHEVVDKLRGELQEATEARMRALADFANFQRRAGENEERVRDAATTSVLRAFMPVLDHIDLALAQAGSEITVEQMLDGVRLLQSEIRKAFQQFDIVEIRPEAGDEFDPTEHQAVMRQPTDEQAPNTVVTVLQVGYRRDDVIIRPATVTVAAPLEGS